MMSLSFKKSYILCIFTTYTIFGYYDPYVPITLNEKQEAATGKLFRACWTGKYESAKKAIARGADVNRCFFPDHKTPLIIASYMKHNGIVLLLLKHNANVHHKTFFGRTALEYAINSHEFGIAQDLMQHGATPHTTNAWGDSPYTSAYTQQDFAVIRFFNTYYSNDHRDDTPEPNDSADSLVHTTENPLFGPEWPALPVMAPKRHHDFIL